MTALPKRYAFLASEGAPRMLVEGLALYGVRERAGPANAPEIMAWAREAGLGDIYTADMIPWCGLYMAVVAKRAGWRPPATPLWARAWAEFGQPTPRAMLGDVLVFTRNGGGHVGIYVGEDKAAYHVLGGNQSDAVTITRIVRSRLLAARQPEWRVAAPPNRRVIRMAANGPLSRNEA